MATVRFSVAARDELRAIAAHTLESWGAEQADRCLLPDRRDPPEQVSEGVHRKEHREDAPPRSLALGVTRS